MTKKEIRKESKERRKALGETQEIEKSEQIRKWVASLPEYQAARRFTAMWIITMRFIPGPS